MEDARIVELYLSRSEAAVRETANKYSAFLHRLANNILRDSCDAEEVVDDTYLKAWNAIPPTVPDNLKYFLSRIARNLSLNRLEQRMSRKRSAQMVVLDELEECVPDTRASVEGIWESREIGEALNRCLKTLEAKNRAVFLGRYYYSRSIEELAADYSLTKRQVKYLLAKMRTGLRVYLQEEGVVL